MMSTLNKRCTLTYIQGSWRHTFRSPAGSWKAGMCDRINRGWRKTGALSAS